MADPRLSTMREKPHSEKGRQIYAKRAEAVESVFASIKAPMGFRQFLLRGLEKVRMGWDLVCLAYNLRRNYSLASS